MGSNHKMEQTKKKYWKGLEELTKNPEFEKYAGKEFPEYLPLKEDSNGEGASRRDFLKLMGFGVAAASLAACETPVKKAIPYLNKPVDVDPGIPNYYASTYVSGSEYSSVVVKTREGRPIKLDGNDLSSLNNGGTSAQAQASVLSLYDKQRYVKPLINGKEASWADLDKQVVAALGSAKNVVVVSNTVFSPSTQAAIDGLGEKYGNVTHVQYDAMSASGMLTANEKDFGQRVVPSYDFSKASVIVSFDADFLGSWGNHSLHSAQFAATRRLGDKKKDMSRLYSFESNLSVTGSNADYRGMIKPSEQGAYVAALYNKLAAKLGGTQVKAPAAGDSKVLDKAVNDLLKAQGKSLVVSGSNDANIQTLVNAINSLLGSYQSTIDLTQPTLTKQGDDKQFLNFVRDLGSGVVDGVIFYNCNPAYNHAQADKVAAGIKKAKFSVSTSDRKDETSDLVTYVAPDHHFLESWNDFEPVKGKFTFSQPTISPLFDTRQAQDSFLTWSGNTTSYFDLLKSKWSEGSGIEGQMAWDKLLQDGVVEKPFAMQLKELVFAGDAAAAASKLSAPTKGVELALYESNTVGTGAQANNPWLQELPDPVTKVVWDNYVSISPAMSEELGLTLGDMTTQLVTLTAGNQTIKLPALVQPGQTKNTVGIALGYGRTKGGKVADKVGKNAFPLVDYSKGFQNLSLTNVKIELSGEPYKLAQTQTHQTFMGRDNVIQESVLSKYKKDPAAGRDNPMISTYSGLKKPSAITLWKGHEYANHHWGMAIDLNSCTGCSACVISCHAENNVPVVGKEEVLNRRDMHWLRIDRYYGSDAEEGDLKGLEVASENPEVTFQPMFCQQCNNAPCETVCPVAATNHSTEGLNQMAYNRCIGTRYCANNCPYKVRRFNWFKYHDNDQFGDNLAMNNDLGKMVLNPDVTVRARGVMEKCSFCVQNIQAGKLKAKREGRRTEDGDAFTACAKSCPSNAIVFGDLKDPKSKVSQLLKIKENTSEDGKKTAEVTEPRAYHVLEELRVDPNVWYFTKIRNKEENEA